VAEHHRDATHDACACHDATSGFHQADIGQPKRPEGHPCRPSGGGCKCLDALVSAGPSVEKPDCSPQQIEHASPTFCTTALDAPRPQPALSRASPTSERPPPAAPLHELHCVYLI
jgi:hypothetical protein